MVETMNVEDQKIKFKKSERDENIYTTFTLENGL